MICSIVLAALFLQTVASYGMYRSEIPNGENVPYPCRAGEKWDGVGHHNNKGTGPQNPFGLDFAAAGHVWSVTLCKKDSDGDGMTNGAELGDPDCVWKKGSAPKLTTGLSHPGVCDPWDSPKCMGMPLTKSNYPTQKEWMAAECKSKGLQCPALNETGIQQIALRLPMGTKIPPSETTYECQIFDLASLGMPVDQDFHIVAVTPILDNKDVLHHIVLSACSEGVTASNGPYECGMVAHEKCQEYVHVWTVGLDGECYHPMSGIRIGKTGVKVVAMQLHWNNPAKKSTYTDSSGLLVHYTPNLRQNDAGVIMIGSAHFVLPPKKLELSIVSTCSGSCTSTILNGAVQITSAWNHMHYAGNKMSIEVFRNNNSVQFLTNDKVYSYDSPQVQLYPNPFQLNPGDTIVSKCGYTTLNRNRSTFFGEATNDEMCFGFITYYPKRNVRSPYCIDQMGFSLCDPATLEGCTKATAFLGMITSTDVYRELTEMCKPFSPCVEECTDSIVAFMRKEKCMQGKVWSYIQDMLAAQEEGRRFLSLIASCKVEVHMAMHNMPPPAPTMKPRSMSSSERPQATNSNSTDKTQIIVVNKCNSAVTAVVSFLLLAVTMVAPLMLKD